MSDPLIVMTVCSDISTGIPGRWINCFQCKFKEIFLSDSTIDAAFEQGDNIDLRPYCSECGFKEIEKIKPKIMGHTKKQLDEIMRSLNSSRVRYK